MWQNSFGVGPKIGLEDKCVFAVPLFLVIKEKFRLNWDPIALLYHIVSPLLRHFSYLEKWFSVPCGLSVIVLCYQPSSHKYCTWRSSVNLRSPIFRFNAGNKWQTQGQEFPWYNRNQHKFLSYGFVRHFGLLFKVPRDKIMLSVLTHVFLR